MSDSPRTVHTVDHHKVEPATLGIKLQFAGQSVAPAVVVANHRYEVVETGQREVVLIHRQNRVEVTALGIQ